MSRPSIALAAAPVRVLRRALACALAPFLTLAARAAAQTPYGPDVLPRGGWQLSLDAQGHRADSREASWLWALPGAAVGLGRGLEASARVSLFEPLRGSGTHDLVPTLRWRAWGDSARALRAGVSAIGLVPVGTIGGRRPRALLTATAAWTAPVVGTTLTVGGWQGVQRAVADGEARRGVILEGVQPLDRDGRTELSVSWFSGRTLFGYLTAGLARTVGAHTLFVGWAHGNAPRFNTGPTVSWSWAP